MALSPASSCMARFRLFFASTHCASYTAGSSLLRYSRMVASAAASRRFFKTLWAPHRKNDRWVRFNSDS